MFCDSAKLRQAQCINHYWKGLLMKSVVTLLALLGGLSAATAASAECPWKEKKAENPPVVGS